MQGLEVSLDFHSLSEWTLREEQVVYSNNYIAKGERVSRTKVKPIFDMFLSTHDFESHEPSLGVALWLYLKPLGCY